MKNALRLMKRIYNMSIHEFCSVIGSSNDYWERKYIKIKENFFVGYCELDESTQLKLWAWAEAKGHAYTETRSTLDSEKS